MHDFSTDFANLLKARFPFLYVPTWEEERVVSVIRQVAGDAQRIRTPRRVFTWTETQGLRSDGWSAPEGTEDLLQALDVIEDFVEPSVFVLHDAHPYFGSEQRGCDHKVVRKLRDLAPVLKGGQAPRSVVFVSPTLHLPMELQKDVTVLEFVLPTADEIRTVLDGIIQANQGSGRITIDLPPQDAERLVKAAVGLTLHEAENAFARAMVGDGRLDARDVETVLEEKRQTIRKSEILEFIASDLDIADVGGLENLKRWLQKRNSAWMDEARDYGLPSPKGVLITGVPGCGKSLLAKSIGSAWQLPLLRLDVGRVFSGLLGSSEQNMRTAIATAEAIAPSILWIDEIEKGFGSAGDMDGGTSTRIFGSFLTWMQEKTKPVFVIATANNINSLPPELLRKGRFDEIFFVDLPTRTERKQIFSVHLAKRLKNRAVLGDFRIDDRTCEYLSGLTEGFVGAEIEQAVIAALFEAFSERRAIRMADFEWVIKNTVPLSVTQAEQIRAIRAWASIRAVAATPREGRAEYQVAGDSPNDGGPTPPAPGAAPAPPADISEARGGRAVDF
ncbi:MAG TPA: AAA family ATPase [Longimicrobium sp.]|jgi:ATP-dependent 26S proteasome regulatory subunit|uniref:AAA family ATPase n=1 Tax=Longimicrobium sp. TaxID=2029185 RepID=UPI002ED85F00